MTSEHVVWVATAMAVLSGMIVGVVRMKTSRKKDIGGFIVQSGMVVLFSVSVLIAINATEVATAINQLTQKPEIATVEPQLPAPAPKARKAAKTKKNKKKLTRDAVVVAPTP